MHRPQSTRADRPTDPAPPGVDRAPAPVEGVLSGLDEVGLDLGAGLDVASYRDRVPVELRIVQFDASSASGTRVDQVLEVFHDPATEQDDEAFDTLVKSRSVVAWLRRVLPNLVRIVTGPPITERALLTTHDPAYVEAVRTGEPEHLASSNGLGWTDGLFNAVLASTGSVVAAAKAAWSRRTVTGCTASGLHHARYGSGAGYCTFNGLVVAAQALLAAGAVRVLVVDLDAHCGGGTASLIEHAPGIEQVDVSVSGYDWYPSRPGARLEMVDDVADYLSAVARALASVERPAEVDLVIYNAGMDPHERSGGMRGIDAAVLRERDRMVMEWAEAHDLPLTFVLAGGYAMGMTMEEVAALHGTTFEEAAASLARRAAA